MNINSMSVMDVVMRLIGPVDPVGQTHEDDRRLANLESLLSLTDSLVTLVKEVRDDNAHSHEYSVKRASKYCANWLVGAGFADESEPEDDDNNWMHDPDMEAR